MRRIKAVGAALGTLLTIIGVITLPDDLKAWQRILTADLLPWAMIIMGLCILAASIFADRLRHLVAKDSIYVRNRTLTTPDLVRMAGDTLQITGRTFDHCTFVGPMMLAINGGIFGDNTVVNFNDAHDRRGALWLMPEGVRVAQGFIALTMCTFTNCDLKQVGFATNEEGAPELRKMLGITPPLDV